MFTVPGWAISSASLVQEQARRDQDFHPPRDSTGAPFNKKRKVTHGAGAAIRPPPTVTSSDLDRLWEQRTEAHRHRPKTSPPQTGDDADAGNAAKSKRRKKKTKHGNVHDASPTQSLLKEKGELGDTANHVQHKQSPHRAVARSPGAESLTGTTATAPAPAPAPTPKPKPTPKLTPLQAKMRNKLTSARFRHLNETLYTTSSQAAWDLFTGAPDLFAEYHAGFAQQVRDLWPENPVDRYVSSIKQRGQIQIRDATTQPTVGDRAVVPLPRRKTGSCTIADLGCGDAQLAQGCQSHLKRLKLRFHSFDLHAANSLVTRADIANLPLRDGEVDIAIFCLSLMGTNWISFVEEAWRILRGDGKGEVWVSEVKSRFGRPTKSPGRPVENSVGKRRKLPKHSDTDPDGATAAEDVFAESVDAPPDDDTDLSAFVGVFSRRGFVLCEDSVHKANKMFVSMRFVKAGVPSAGKYQGLKWNGHEYVKVPEAKFKSKRGRAGGGMADDDVPLEEETKVLKPCVYKTR